MKEKECSKCNKTLPASEFNKDRHLKSGLKSECKKCSAAKSKEYHQKNRDEILKKQREWRKNNLERERERIRVYDKENAHKRRRYRQENKEQANAHTRKWAKKNREYLRNKMRERRKDPNFKILGNLRRRVRSALTDGTKSKRTLELLGCSVEEWRKYLEGKFQPGMSWDNYGLHGWHIDHIKPCSLFDLTDPKQQEECFHYSNTQPLWAKDNLSKNNKFTPPAS